MGHKVKKVRLLRFFMKTNNKLKIILLFSFLIGVFLIFNSFTETRVKNDYEPEKVQVNKYGNENYLKQSDYWPDVTFIHIDGNWTKTNSTYDWCSGSGTWEDPYVIQNVTVNAGGLGNGILINNSKNVYFKIKNCTVYNSGSLAGDAGIRLENTNNGTIINSTCFNNAGIGIFLINSENNTISDKTL